jgi:hypothetical protein
MTGTIYTIHSANDHSILETATPGDLQAKAANVAARIGRGLPDGQNRTWRVYVHNGRGVVAAGLCRDGLWHDILRDDYMAFEPKARALRVAAGFPVDEVTP